MKDKITMVETTKSKDGMVTDLEFYRNGNLTGCGYLTFGPRAHTGLIRCPSCVKENYAMMVASGICAFCGFNSTKLTTPQT